MSIPKFVMLPRPECDLTEAEIAAWDGQAGERSGYEISTNSPDGYYLDHRGDWLQIIVIGNAEHTATELALRFPGFELHRTWPLHIGPDVAPDLAARGFESIILRATAEREKWIGGESEQRRQRENLALWPWDFGHDTAAKDVA